MVDNFKDSISFIEATAHFIPEFGNLSHIKAGELLKKFRQRGRTTEDKEMLKKNILNLIKK